MATKNILAGPVVETQNALTKEIDKIDTLDLDIHHFLFTKTKSSNIQYVASHIQALNQTKRTREKLIPNAIEIECADTALAATLLANGTYSENYAIICRKNIGLFYNLFLFAENIEDDSRNKTTFGLFQLKNWIYPHFMHTSQTFNQRWKGLKCKLFTLILEKFMLTQIAD